jgi:hypothetical protein
LRKREKEMGKFVRNSVSEEETSQVREWLSGLDWWRMIKNSRVVGNLFRFNNDVMW